MPQELHKLGFFYGPSKEIYPTLEPGPTGESVEEIGIGEQFYIQPAPMISINSNLSYTNDNIVGYKYTISLDGTVTNPYHPTYTGVQAIGTAKLMGELDKLRRKLTYYAADMYIYDIVTGEILMMGQNGILQTLSFDNSNDKWLKTVPYKATIEFQDLWIKGDSGNFNKCQTGDISSLSMSTELIDRNKHKIKSFNDSWSFSTDAQKLYSDVNRTEYGIPTELRTGNLTFEIRYNIDAIGMNYSHYDEELGDTLFVPAWEHAKHFCQERLFKQISKKVYEMLYIHAAEACSGTQTLVNLYDNSVDTEVDVLLFNTQADIEAGAEAEKDLIEFKIYNETIRCETSEGDGSFSAEYSSLLIIERPFREGDVPRPEQKTNYGVKHTFTKNIQSDINGTQLLTGKKNMKINNVITIEGEIQGLVEGGLLFKGGDMSGKAGFQLPKYGYLVVDNADSKNTKFDNAEAFAKIFFDDKVRITQEDRDLAENSPLPILNIDKAKDIAIRFKKQMELALRKEDIIAPNAQGNIQPYALPESFSLTKDYANGKLAYSIKYTSGKTGATLYEKGKYSTISIDIQRGVPVIATHVIPNGVYYTEYNPKGVENLIQYMGTRTRDTLNITVEGHDSELELGYIYRNKEDEEATADTIDEHNSPHRKIYKKLLDSNIPIVLPSGFVVPSNAVLTENTKTTNILTGSYSIKQAYILCHPGCNIAPPVNNTGSRLEEEQNQNN